MKQGLSLRVSQHLALTPQLQQSIRLLQLSTLELSQEVEQMLDENPFLERAVDEAPREEFGLAQADVPVSAGDRLDEIAESGGGETFDPADSPAAAVSGEDGGEAAVAESWDGDGSVDITPDDGEWGGEAPARGPGSLDDEDAPDALARSSPHESLTDVLERQALALRLDAVDRAALRFLIGSLTDDGYLEDPLDELAQSLAGDDLEQREELVHRFTVALGLLQSMEPTGVGARNLAECLALQLRALPDGLPGEGRCMPGLWRVLRGLRV